MVNVIVKVSNDLSPETIVDAIGQTLRISKASIFDNTLSIRINFYHDFRSTSKQQNIQHYLLADSHIQFRKIRNARKTMERTKIETDEVTKINTPDDFVNAESNTGNNTMVVSVDQISL